MNDKMNDYWYSESHAQHYAASFPIPDRISKNAVTLSDGEQHTYTACRKSKDNASEPYNGALSIFPDYRKIGSAPSSKAKRIGFWN